MTDADVDEADVDVDDTDIDDASTGGSKHLSGGRWRVPVVPLIP